MARSILALIVLMAFALPARADKKDPNLIKAEAHFKVGEAYFQSGEYAQAIEEYKKAYDLSKKPLLLFNIGQAHRLSGNPDRAIESYEQYLAADPKGSRADAAKAALRELRNRDADVDGLPDLSDKCRDEPEDRDGHEDADGCPEPDNDVDGLLDAVDLCPDEREDMDGVEDRDGCPDADAPVAPPDVDRRPDPGPREAMPVPQPPATRTDRGGGGLQRTLFFTSAGVTLAATAGWIFTGLRVRAIEDDMSAAIAAHDFTPVMHPDDMCREADADGYGELQSLCSDQKSMAFATNVLIGVSIVGALATTWFFYKAYLARSSRSERRAASDFSIVPVVSRSEGGIHAVLTF